MAFSRGPNIVIDELRLYLDGTNIKSYPGTGTNWYNIAAPESYDSSIINGASFSNYGNYKALRLEGESEDQYVNIPSAGILNFGSDFTMEVLVNIPITATWSNGDVFYPIFTNDDTFAGSYGIGKTYDDRIKFYIFQEGISISVDDNLKYRGNWYLVCATWGGGTASLYIDGVLKDTQFDSSTPNTGSVNLVIGKGANYLGTYGDYLDGQVALVRYYRKALSQEEVVQNYEATKSRFQNNIKKEGLVLYLDSTNVDSYSSTGLTWYDLSGYENNGTLENGLTYSKAKFEFDGTNDYVSLGKSFIDSGEIGSGDISYTLEAWIYLNGTPGSSTNGYSIIGNASAYGIGMQLQNSSGIKVNFGFRSTSNVFSTSNLSLNTWYHIVCTREAGVNNRIYINGQLDKTYDSQYLSVVTTTAEMQIGWANGRLTNFPFEGEMAIVRLYNTYLTDDEVLQNYNSDKYKFGL